MAIVVADAKSLEWISFLYLSQDKEGIAEWLAFVENSKLNDIHSKNQKDLNLSSRLIAKIFLFRCIYRGPAYAYANDPDFSKVSKSAKFWQKIIDTFFEKYYGLNEKHISLIKEATTTGKNISPFGREHEHESKNGEWNVSDITNHINQGLGADVMVIARISFANRWINSKLEGKLISTVHDNIIVDTPSSNIIQTTKLFHETFRDLPKAISNTYKLNWSLPLLCEVKAGNNQKDLQEVHI